MNCCDRLLIVFIIFAFCQFQLRWDRDTEVTNKPWQVYSKGSTDFIHKKSGTYIKFTKAAVAYGVPSCEILPDKIISKDRHEVIMTIQSNITGPSMSFHRIVIEVGSEEAADMTQFISPLGYSSGYMHKRFIHMPSSPIKIKYYYDDVWENGDVSKADVSVSIHSGVPNLWDVKWSDVYIRT